MPFPPPHECSAPGRRDRRLHGLVVAAAGAACAVAALLISTPASAYVRARTRDTFMPLFWPDPRLTLEVARPPDGLGISATALRDAALSAANTWSFPTVACTGVSLTVAAGTVDSQTLARDGNNRIIMRAGNWDHNSSIVALTTVFQRGNPGKPNDGQILEADIELNAVDYAWAVVPEGPLSGRDYANTYDLAGVLTHETGHFIGLDHTCAVPGADPLVDDKGDATPDCSYLPLGNEGMFVDATMYPFMREADLTPRTLTADDARAACEVYPPSSVPWQEWSGAGGCAVVAAPSRARDGASWFWVAALALAAVTASRHRRGQRRRRHLVRAGHRHRGNRG